MNSTEKNMADLQKLYNAVLNGDQKTSVAVTQEALAEGVDPMELITQYMVPAMDEVGSILTVILAGDGRLSSKLEHPDLLPLASRIRCRLRTEALPPQQLLACLSHLLKLAGNPKLMSPTLLQTLCEHAAGNLRLLMNLANDLLSAAAHQEREQLDEKLYFEVFNPDPKPTPRRNLSPS